MSREEIYERLNEVFQDVFGDDDITVNDDTTAKDIDGWDSLRHITLLAAIEDEFDIEFSMGQTVKMKNVGEMVDYIEDEELFKAYPKFRDTRIVFKDLHQMIIQMMKFLLKKKLLLIITIIVIVIQ